MNQHPTNTMRSKLIVSIIGDPVIGLLLGKSPFKEGVLMSKSDRQSMEAGDLSCMIISRSTRQERRVIFGEFADFCRHDAERIFVAVGKKDVQPFTLEARSFFKHQHIPVSVEHIAPFSLLRKGALEIVPATEVLRFIECGIEEEREALVKETTRLDYRLLHACNPYYGLFAQVLALPEA